MEEGMEQHVSSTHHHVLRAHFRFTHSPNIILSLQMKPMKPCVKVKCNARDSAPHMLTPE